MGKTLNKLNYLKETKSQIKTALNQFGAGITNDTFRSYVTKISDIYANWTKLTDEDSQINLTPTRKGKMNLTLNSTQLTQDGTPSPSTPVEVNTITGNNNIHITNADSSEEQNYPISLSSKNLFDYSKIVNLALSSTVVEATNYKGYYIPYVQGTTYTISRNTTTNEKNNRFRVCFTYDKPANGVEFYNGEGTPGQWYSFDNDLSGTVQSNIDFKYLFIYLSNNSTSPITEEDVKIQIEEGSTATTYEPYYNIEYCKIGDYADQIFKNTTESPYYDNTLIENEWYLKKNIGKVVLDGSESGWTNVGGNAPYKYSNSNIIMSSSDSDTNLLSNYYPCKKWSDTWSSFDYMVVQTRSGQSIQFRNVNISTLEEFKVWLSTHNTTVYYPLATPTYIHITETGYPTLYTQLNNIYNNSTSYEGTTNITQTNDDLPFNINASALMKGDE